MPELTVIVPTMNEADNIAPLVARLSAALAGCDAEILFVDDSSDETVATIERVSATSPTPLRVIARSAAERDGLSGAVVRGLSATDAPWVCVMDGDLQHPPEVVPLLLERGKVSSAEIVVASRQANRLGPVGLTRTRSLISNLLTLFARALFPRSLKDVSDPLTGFFLVRRAAINVSSLRPDGFKILLEILVRHPNLRASELFFDFALRNAGSSKADLREGMRFFRHVLRLRRTVHTRPLARLGAVSAASLGVSVGALGWLTGRGRSPLAAAWLATLLGDSVRWLGRRQLVLPKHERDYHLGNRFWLASGIFTSFVMLPILQLLRRFAQLPLSVAYLLSFFASGFVRYMLSDRWVWSRGLVGTQATHVVYNIHDRIVIHSPVSIPDLAYFQSTTTDRTPDVVIRVDRHGTPRQFESTVSFDDRLGRFGFALTVVPSAQPVEVVISPLIASAPHVLYVNLVLPLLRYLCLSKGMLLARAAAVAADGGVTLLMGSEQRNGLFAHLEVANAERYVAHNWVLLGSDGTAYPFPIALTVRKLLEDTRLRRAGAAVRQVPQVPASTLMAWTQRLFPPLQVPIVQKLARERIAPPLPLVAVQGGGNSAESIANQLLQDADDPLGFPLYAMLVENDGGDSAEKERLLTVIRRILEQQ